MPPSLKAMEYFTTALRHGNIAQAAGELNIAASAVAAAIGQVEDAFGMTLVTRQRARGIQPTASGLTIARRCESLLEEYRALLSEGAELGQSLSGTLRVGYYAPVAPAFLPEILRRFVPDPTQVTFHLHECDNDAAQIGLLDGSFDVILFVSEDVRPSISFDRLIEAPPYCLLPKGHPVAQQDTVTLAQIAQQPLVVLDRPVTGSYYRALFDAQGEAVTIAAYANSTEMLRSLVGSGFGCAVLNMRPAVAATYAGASVVARPISDPLRPLTLSVGYDPTRPRQLVRRFVAACRTTFAEATAEQFIVGTPDRSCVNECPSTE